MKGYEGAKRMQKIIVERVVDTFDGGYIPNINQIIELVEAFTNTRAFKTPMVFKVSITLEIAEKLYIENEDTAKIVKNYFPVN
jgi:hypothetical protein